MNLNLLRSFVAVADLASYSRAAVALELSQPAVYQHVRQLERAFAVKLVEQMGKRVLLTESGRMVYDYARHVNGLTDDVTRTLLADAGQTTGSLVLVAGTTVGEFLLPPICVRFQRRCPQVRMTVRVQTAPEEIERIVRDREADMGFSGRPTSTPGIVSSPFVDDEVVAIVPAGHPLARLEALRQRELAALPLVLPEASRFQIMRSLVNTWFHDAGCEPACAFEINAIEGIKSAVREGAGVGIVSRLVVREDDSSLVVLPLVGAPVRSFHMIMRTSGWQARPTTAFKEFVQSGEWRGPDEDALNSHRRQKSV